MDTLSQSCRIGNALSQKNGKPLTNITLFVSITFKETRTFNICKKGNEQRTKDADGIRQFWLKCN